jgi:methionyl-tRNA formyltransferase
LKTLEALYANRGRLIGRLEVVTHSTTAVQGESKVASWSRKLKIPVHEWPHPKPLPESLLPWNFDIGVVVSFGYLIPQALIKSFPKSMINMHPSLLPKYRGPAPIYHALLNSDSETAVSIITLHPTEFDKGEILVQQRVPIELSDTHLTLEPRLAALGADLLIHTLLRFDELYSKRWSQNNIGIEPSKARILTTKDANVQWARWTALEVFGRWRAQPNKVYSFFRGRPVKFPTIALPTPSTSENISAIHAASAASGTIVWDKASRSLLVKCKEGWIGVYETQIPGKSRVTAEAFANGFGLKTSDATNRFEYADREATTVKEKS